MKKIILLALMISLLVLPGCASQNTWEEELGTLREELSLAPSMAFSAEITTDLGSGEFSCTLFCERSERGITATVLAPEMLSGVRAHFGEGVGLSYDGVLLYVGEVPVGISPASAMPIIVRALESGFVQRLWREESGETELLVLQIYEDDETDVKLWLETDGFTPVFAEIIYNGAAILRCAISGFTLEN